MSDIDLRPAAPADIRDITEIYRHSVENGTATYELEPPSEAEMRARFARLTGSGFPYIVATQSGRLVGYAYVGPFRDRPAYRFMVENSIYLAPDAQGLGLGRRLLERLLADSTALGFRQMIAVIGDGRPDSASVKLHERFGFRHCGTITGSGYKHGRWLDTVLMQIEMNGGTAAPPDPDSLPERTFRLR